jgi:hypothetical protein
MRNSDTDPYFSINKGTPFELISDPLDEEDPSAPFGSYTKCSPEMCFYCPYDICPLTGNPK